VKNKILNAFITLAFATPSTPNSPIPLGPISMKKLGQIPRLVGQFARSQGSSIAEPILASGAVHLAINDESDLFDVGSEILKILNESAQKISSNAQLQPPLPIGQVVSDLKIFDLLRELALAFEKSSLIATIIMGGKEYPLPLLPVSDFTQAAHEEDSLTRTNQEVRGLCRPSDDGNVIVLSNGSLMELPFVDYELDLLQLQSLIFLDNAQFAGWAKPSGRGVLRAQPGGELTAQTHF